MTTPGLINHGLRFTQIVFSSIVHPKIQPFLYIFKGKVLSGSSIIHPYLFWRKYIVALSESFPTVTGINRFFSGGSSKTIPGIIRNLPANVLPVNKISSEFQSALVRIHKADRLHFPALRILLLKSAFSKMPNPIRGI